MMKHYIIGIAILLVMLLLPDAIMAKEKTTLYLFFGNGCPHCADAKAYLASIQNEYPEMEVIGYEVFDDDANVNLWQSVKKALQSDSQGVPFIVIGERYLTGFAEYRKADITAALDYYRKHPTEYIDIVAAVKDGKFDDKQETSATKTPEVHPVKMNEWKRNQWKKIPIYGGLLIFTGIIYWYIDRKIKRSAS